VLLTSTTEWLSGRFTLSIARWKVSRGFDGPTVTVANRQICSMLDQ
jgi:hypothetical protein